MGCTVLNRLRCLLPKAKPLSFLITRRPLQRAARQGLVILAEEPIVNVELAMPEPKAVLWTRRHLLDLEDLSRLEIETILDAAEGLVAVSQRKHKKLNTLKGKVVV